MGAKENKAFARRLVEEILNNWNPDAVDGVFADDFVNHQRGAVTGDRDELKRLMGGLYVAFPDLKWTIEHLIAEGDLVSVYLTGHGTHQGEFQGIAPTGKSVTFEGMGIIRIADGKVAERWNIQDAAGLMAQLTS